MRVIISGGGTAGHINPGIAVAKTLVNLIPDTKILFVGAKTGLEKDLVPKEGFELKLINVKGFKRKISLDTFTSIKELFMGMYQARKILKEFKPDIVIGTGGYVCGPVLLNASIMGIKTLIHEQNAMPGATNKILSKFVDAVLISFQDAGKFFNAKKMYLTGNPIRKEILSANREECRTKLNITDKKLIAAFGGSIGAQKINNLMINYIKSGIPNNIRIIFGTGSREYESVCKELEGIKLGNVTILPYIDNMNVVMPAADLVICRAGAITVSELAAVGVPSILIPSPNVTGNHQEYNARSLEKYGAAKVLLECNLESIDIKKYIEDLINDDKALNKMRENGKKMAIADASEKIVDIIEEMVGISDNYLET